MEKYWVKNHKWELGNEGLPHSSLDEDINFENLLKLQHCNLPEILFHLNKRYSQKQIYTFTGKILIAINPFEKTNLYSPEIIQEFISKIKPNYPIKTPHLYELVNSSLNFNKCSFLISGESGSGKTESTKKILEYFTHIHQDENQIVNKILDFNSILEAFGNASTLRNHNSSRFGKYINIFVGETLSAEIKTYLLEKVRLISDESNYHIFYMINPNYRHQPKYLTEQREDWDYEYLKLENLKKCWVNGGLDETLWDKIIKTLEGIIELENDNEEKVLEKWELETGSLKVLKQKTFQSGIEKLTVDLDEKEKNNVKQTLIMNIYSKLFEIIVSEINKKLNFGLSDKSYGILDIFGFEVFKKNSFEQLCINYTNENLQNIFNKFVFEEEIKLFTNEGILKDKVNFQNNQHILSFFEQSFFPLLDEKSMLNGTDQDLLLTLPQSEVIKKKRESFIINHYAEPVEYDLGRFTEKNIEKGNIDINEFLGNFYKKFGIEPVKKNKRRGSIGKDTVSLRFRNDLRSLIETIKENELYFIRCLKPNSLNLAQEWDEDKVENQLHYCGVISAVELARQTFPIRISKESFREKYSIIIEGELEDFFDNLLENQFLEGKTLVFYTNEMQDKINELMIEKQKELMQKLIYQIKMICSRSNFKDKVLGLQKIQNQFRNFKSKNELKKRRGILKIQTHFRKYSSKKYYLSERKKIIKIQRRIKNKLKIKSASKTIQNYIYTKLIRRKYKIDLENEKNNIQNLIEIKVQEKLLEREKNYQENINKLHNDLDKKIDEKRKLNNKVLELDRYKSLYEEELSSHKIMDAVKKDLEFEKKRCQEIRLELEKVQQEYLEYKQDVREAQKHIGEKMYNLYNELSQLKEENMRLSSEFRISGKWYQKLFG